MRPVIWPGLLIAGLALIIALCAALVKVFEPSGWIG
jgi:hypothetical protein